MSDRGRLRELALLFLRLGTVGFGGPAAHIALMEEEVVRRRGWLRRDEFLDLVGAVNLLPGPNSTELAIHVGRRRAGTAGLLVAGVCFILPAAVMVLACAWAYRRYGQVPVVAAMWDGVKPVVLAIVLVAMARFARSALTRPLLVGTACAAVSTASRAKVCCCSPGRSPWRWTWAKRTGNRKPARSCCARRGL